MNMSEKKRKSDSIYAFHSDVFVNLCTILFFIHQLAVGLVMSSNFSLPLNYYIYVWKYNYPSNRIGLNWLVFGHNNRSNSFGSKSYNHIGWSAIYCGFVLLNRSDLYSFARFNWRNQQKPLWWTCKIGSMKRGSHKGQ